MKTLLSFGIAGWLSVGLLGCSGDDEASPVTLPAVVPGAVDAVPDVPAVVTGTPVSNPPPSDDVIPDTDPPSIDETAPDPVAPRRELEWRACGQFENRNLECAEVEVPVDYDAPDGETLPLAVRRILADPLEPHRGALLFNPGGPGGEGIDSALQAFEGGVFDAIAPGFDIVGFDPRGVGASGERGCGSDPAAVSPAETQSELQARVESVVLNNQALGARCEREWGPLFRQLGSNNVVRDMDEIRKALNEPRLNFLGASYGTRLGALYAHAYPQTTGRIVLDGAMHPRATVVELLRGQFHAEVELHEQVLLACEAGTIPCPPEARQVFEQMRSNARGRGIEADFLQAWRRALDSLESLEAALAAEAADPGGDWILSFVQGGEDGIGPVPFASVMCTDDTVAPPTIEQLDALVAEYQGFSALFASNVTETALCAGWPTTRDPVPLPTAIAAPPLLVIGGTADVHTPYEWAQAMTETLGNATLLTSHHFGHVALSDPSPCVLQTVRAYLTSGSMPASGAECP